MPEGMVIQFVEVVPMAVTSPTERLIDEGRLIKHAEQGTCRRAKEMVAEMSAQKKALARLAFGAVSRYPALMFRAMFEGWSLNKVTGSRSTNWMVGPVSETLGSSSRFSSVEIVHARVNQSNRRCHNGATRFVGRFPKRKWGARNMMNYSGCPP